MHLDHWVLLLANKVFDLFILRLTVLEKVIGFYRHSKEKTVTTIDERCQCSSEVSIYGKSLSVIR